MTYSVEPSTVVEALKILTTASQVLPKDSTSGTLLEDLLTSSIAKYDETLRTSPAFSQLCILWDKDSSVVNSPDSMWKFVLYCLKMLELLQQSVTSSLKEFQQSNAPNSHKMLPDTLSFNEQKVIKGAVQFVVGLGICPNLHKGVGVPLYLRSGYSQFIKMSETEDAASQDEKNQHLYHCIRVLFSCIRCPALSTLILTQHLVDILAALFQLNHIREQARATQIIKVASKNDDMNKSGVCSNVLTEKEHYSQHRPDTSTVSLCDMNPASIVDYVRAEAGTADSHSKQYDANKPCRNCSDENSFTEELGAAADICQLTGLSEDEFEFCEKSAEHLLAKLYPPLLVKTLLLLQGAPKSKKQCMNTPALQPAPKWLRQECGHRLTAIIMRPNGVQCIVRGMLDEPGAGKGMTGAIDWRKCDAVAKVIACCPLQSLSVEVYYRKIFPQILELLHIPDKQVCRQFLRVACSTISSMASQHPELTRDCVITPLLKPLMMCSEKSDVNVTVMANGHMIVEEHQLAQCIEDCHKVFVSGSADNVWLISSLQPVILLLYRLYVFTKPGVAAIKTCCQELLVTFLKHAEPSVTLTCLHLMTFQNTSQSAAEFPRMHQHLKFINGKEGGVAVTAELGGSSDGGFEEASVDCIVTLMTELRSTSIPGQYLVFMLKELAEFIKGEVSVDNSESPHQSSRRLEEGQALLDLEQQYQSRLDQFYRKLTLLNVLAAVCEALGPDCISNAQQTLEFVKATLERGVQVCKATEDVMFETFHNETLTMAMGLLTALMTGASQLTDEDRRRMQELLPLLQEISSVHRDPSVQEMATDIRIAVATHGAVWSEVSKSKGQNFGEMFRKIKEEKENVSKSQLKSKIEVIGENILESKHTESLKALDKDSQKVQKLTTEQSKTTANLGMAATSNTDQLKPLAVGDRRMDTEIEVSPSDKTVPKKTSEEDNRSQLDKAFEELCDPLIPVRGHGLIRLTKLVQKRDPQAQKCQSVILKIFEENLDHGDSYIYLSAVNGLAALCDWNPSLVLPRICEQFVEKQLAKEAGKGSRSSELRMKLGEVMVRASRALGETVPKYRDLLLSSVLIGVRDTDPLIRASSLSNLGDICRLLSFSLGNFVHEVYECCSSVLKHDNNVQVRKAAAQAITLLLQGTGDSVIKILDTVLKDLYRLLKHVMYTEKDDGVKLQVHLALNELDDIMRRQLFPPQKLEKKIRVLDPD